MVLLLALTAQAADLAVIDQVVESGELGEVVAVVVEQGGQVVHHRQYRAGVHRRGSTSDDPTLHDIRSAGKSLTALAVGAAIEDGHLASTELVVWPLLGLDAPDGLEDVRVHDLLSMSSALDCNDWDRRSPGQEERMYRRKDWTRFVARLPADASYQRDGQGVGRFSYCTAGVYLLGQVVENSVGERFDHYVQRRLLAPMGIAQVAWRASRSGQIQSGGQLEVSAEALARIGRLVLDGGVWDGRTLLDAAWVDDMLTERARVHPEVGYGYLWWRIPVTVDGEMLPCWAMLGNGGNLVLLSERQDAVVVVQAANYNEPTAQQWSMVPVRMALTLLEATHETSAERPAQAP